MEQGDNRRVMRHLHRNLIEVHVSMEVYERVNTFDKMSEDYPKSLA
jgi:hypothetical protein